MQLGLGDDGHTASLFPRTGAALIADRLVAAIPAEQTPGHETDLEVIADGYIAVTPLQVDLTHYASLAAVAEGYA